MADTTWKAGERRTAAILGARRQPGSGSQGDPGRSTSDSTHPRLYIEEKYRAVHTARTLFDAEKKKAKKEGKTLVLSLRTKGKPGVLLCFHSDDIPEVLARMAVNLPRREQEAFYAALHREESLVQTEGTP